MANLSLKTIGLQNFPPIVTDFAQYMKSILARSELTVCEYLLDIRTFLRFLCATDQGLNLYECDVTKIDISKVSVNRLAEVDTDFLIKFVFYLDNQRDNSGSSKRRKVASLRAFFRFLHIKKHLIPTNPAIDLEAPKIAQTLPKYLTLDESISLLQSIYYDQESKNRQRDFAIVTLFLNCGMRLSELCGINLTDIDRNWEYITVVGKGGKKRQVFLNETCRAALYPYLRIRLDGNPEKNQTTALFLSSRNKRISNKTVQAMVYKYLEMAGLGNRGLSVHKLRHTAATLMYQEGGVDVRVLQELLGHAQLNTTQIYTHVGSRSVRAAVEQNPLQHVKFERRKNDDS